MQDLVARPAEGEYSARAALWLGHLAYGTERLEEALHYFTQALERGADPATRSEAHFWWNQCANLLGQEPPPAEPERPEETQAVLGEIARRDGALRLGDAADALHGYLSLEGRARQGGCLGVLLYRLALVNSVGGASRATGASDPVLMRQWQTGLGNSADRALAMTLLSRAPGGPPEGNAGDDAADSTRTDLPAVQPAGAVTPLSSPAAPEDDSVRADPGLSATRAGPRPPEGEGPDMRTPKGVPSANEAYYAIQLGAFADRNKAIREMERLAPRELDLRLEVDAAGSTTLYKIRLGRWADRATAAEAATQRCRGLEYRVVQVLP